MPFVGIGLHAAAAQLKVKRDAKQNTSWQSDRSRSRSHIVTAEGSKISG